MDGLPDTLAPWLAARLAGQPRITGARRFGTGQSNPTWRLETETGPLVLRAKPPGTLLPKAHMVEREHRVMGALAGSGVPVPRMLLLAEADNPLGRAFYVMEHLDGRIFWDPALPELARADRARVFDAMADVLSALARIDPADVGLSGYGRANGFFARQTALWSRQYAASVTDPDPAMVRIQTWLDAHVPGPTPPALVHGDFRLDNMVFHPTEPRVIGLLDWELSTLGAAAADPAYQVMQWRLANDGPLRGLGGVDRADRGLPSDAAYLARLGRDPAALHPWMVLAAYRFAAILAGVGARAAAGNASNPEQGARYGAMVPDLIALAEDWM